MGLIITYSALSFIYFIYNKFLSDAGYNNILSVLLFVGGASEVLLSCLLWFVFNDDTKPIFIKQNEFVYPVVDVIADRKSINIAEVDQSLIESEVESEIRSKSFNASIVAEKLFA